MSTRAHRSTHAQRVRLRQAELMAAAKKHKAARDANERGANKRDGKLPLSGGEEQFTNLVWGSPEGIAGNNCYGYALGVYRDGGYKKMQPGELAGTASAADDLTKCASLKKRTLEDLSSRKGGGYEVRPEEKCLAGHYKIMGFVAPGKDYHWYRQNGDMMIKADGKDTVTNIAAKTGVSANSIESPSEHPKKCDPILVKKAGLWAHKRGLNELTVKDADGKYITDPRRADRNYGKLNYTTFCGAFCVKSSFGKNA